MLIPSIAPTRHSIAGRRSVSLCFSAPKCDTISRIFFFMAAAVAFATLSLVRSSSGGGWEDEAIEGGNGDRDELGSRPLAARSSSKKSIFVTLPQPSLSRPRVILLSPGKGKIHYQKGRSVAIAPEEIKRMEKLADEKYYDDRRPQQDRKECVPSHPWQMTSFPNCNKIHEIDRSIGSWSMGLFENLGQGGFNHVFTFKTFDGSGMNLHVMKQLILRPRFELTENTLDVARTDGLVMERLTSSPYVVEAYSYCGTSTLVPKADNHLGAYIFDRKEPLSPEERLNKSIAAASAISDLERIGFVHMDYMVRQYLIMLGGKMKLNDFNKGRWVSMNQTSGEPCRILSFGEDGTFQSPELYQKGVISPKTQVYSLGNVLQSILTGVRLWDCKRKGIDEEQARMEVAQGIRDPIPKSVSQDTNPAVMAMKEAVDMCFTYDPAKRPDAREVERFLRDKARILHLDIEMREKGTG